MLKESKITVLENFYGIDYALFGKPLAKVESCCPLLKEDYLSIKGALLSVYIEMLKLVEHEPRQLSEFVDSDSLKRSARNSAKIAREYAERIVKSTKARADIKEALKESIEEDPNADVSSLVEYAIRQKAMSIAVDSLLVAKALNEAVEVANLNTWEGSLLEDSYKILRDNLIESAWQILESQDDEYLDEVHMTQPEKDALFTGINRLFGACAQKCGRIAISSERRACKKACQAEKDRKIQAARAKLKAKKAEAKAKQKVEKTTAAQKQKLARKKAGSDVWQSYHQRRADDAKAKWKERKAAKKAKESYKKSKL